MPSPLSPPSQHRRSWLSGLPNLQDVRQSVFQAAKETIDITRDTDYTALSAGLAAGAGLVAAQSLQQARSVLSKESARSVLSKDSARNKKSLPRKKSQGFGAAALRGGRAAVSGVERRIPGAGGVLGSPPSGSLKCGVAGSGKESEEGDIEAGWEFVEWDECQGSLTLPKVSDHNEPSRDQNGRTGDCQGGGGLPRQFPLHQQTSNSTPYRADEETALDSTYTNDNAPKRHCSPYSAIDSEHANTTKHTTRLDNSIERAAESAKPRLQAERGALNEDQRDNDEQNKEDEFEDVELRGPIEQQSLSLSKPTVADDDWDDETMSIFERASRLPARRKSPDDSRSGRS